MAAFGEGHSGREAAGGEERGVLTKAKQRKPSSTGKKHLKRKGRNNLVSKHRRVKEEAVD